MPRGKKKRVEPASRGLLATELARRDSPAEVAEIEGKIEKDGGAVLRSFRDPLGGKWQILAALPIEKVAPTRFQRDQDGTAGAHGWRARGVAMRLSSGISLAAALTLASAAAAQPRARLATPDLRTASVVDLTHTFDSETLYWPTSPTTFELTSLTSGMTPGGWFYSANSFCAPEHGGTHLDAPIHFGKGQRTADQVPVRQLVAPAVVIDVVRAAAADPDYRLTVADVRGWEKRHGTIPGGSIVLLRTGWSKRWPDRKRYFGDDTPGDASNLHFPSYGEEAAGLLVRERKVGGLGVDTASIDYGPSTNFPVHRLSAAANVPGLENLADLESVPESGAWIVALPMKIAGGSGGPLRAIALVPRP